jgi:hypothetical protein
MYQSIRKDGLDTKKSFSNLNFIRAPKLDFISESETSKEEIIHPKKSRSLTRRLSSKTNNQSHCETKNR